MNAVCTATALFLKNREFVIALKKLQTGSKRLSWRAVEREPQERIFLNWGPCTAVASAGHFSGKEGTALAGTGC